MPKKLKINFDDKLTFDSLIQAYERASIGKKNKKEVLLFEMDLETNIIKILNELKNETYEFGKYRTFIIHEPKTRVIKSLPFKDRIVHQWYIGEFIKPYMQKRFIKDTYACLDKRGTHNAVNTTQKYMRRMQKECNNYYVLKVDIKKYFYSINKDILMSILSRFLKDGENIGIPIGNYTSQWFANIYLNSFDHYIKEVLKIKYYVRYMDDFICLLKTKKECKYILNNINDYLNNHLELKLNQKTRYYPNKFGINFCGFKIFETHRLIRNRAKRKIKNNIKLWNKLYDTNKVNNHKVLLCWNSFKGHAKHANSFSFINKIYNELRMKEKYKKIKL